MGRRLLGILFGPHVVHHLPEQSPGVSRTLRVLKFVGLSAPPSLSPQPASLLLVAWQPAAVTKTSPRHPVQRRLCIVREVYLRHLQLRSIYLGLLGHNQLADVPLHNLDHLVVGEVAEPELLLLPLLLLLLLLLHMVLQILDLRL